MKEAKYLTQIEEINKRLECLEGQLNQIGWLRVGSFLLGLFSIIGGYEVKNNFYYVLGILFLIGFIYLVKYYNHLKAKVDYEKAKKGVLEEYIKRLNNEWLNFTEQGEAYLNREVPRVKDLDLIGRCSLFQYLCMAHTSYGKEALASTLVKGIPCKAIVKRQEAIKELLKEQEFSLHLETLSYMIADQEEENSQQGMEEFINKVEESGKKQGLFIKSLSFILPFISLFFLVLLGVKKTNEILIWTGVIAILFQSALGIWRFSYHSAIFSPIIRFSANIEVYKAFLLAIENKNFQSDYLKSLRESLCEAGGVEKALNDLEKLAGSLKVRSNGVGYMILSSLLMWDFHCMDVFYNWQKQYGSSIRKWLKVMGEVEVLLSLAVICKAKEHYVFPKIEEKAEPANACAH